MSRPLRVISAAPGAEMWTAVEAALDGSGPALLPIGADRVESARVTAALRPGEPLEHDDVALVIATSGSTGEPKGVLLSAAALGASGAAASDRLGGQARWLLALPAHHIGGMQVVLRSLQAGAPPVVATGADPEAFVAATALLGHGRRCTSLVPTQLRRLLAAGPAATQALAAFDAVLVGGAAATPGLLADARAAGVQVVTTYGMSETSGGCVYDGSPLAGVAVHVDAKQRIALSGPVLATGYRLRPDLSAAAFRDGRYATGDVGRIGDDGRLVVLGRADDVIVTGGEKVAPAAVEAALAEHPAVVEVAVVGTPDPEWGQRVVAVVVLRDGQHLTLAQVRDHVADRVSRVAAPRELRLYQALPLLPSGKVDRHALRS